MLNSLEKLYLEYEVLIINFDKRDVLIIIRCSVVGSFFSNLFYVGYQFQVLQISLFSIL